MRQELINRLLVRAARSGRRVVRLKGGDPFVFGRGGEEALALVAAGIPFEVVPGVSSAVAAAELAGIPVTHRGVAAAFVVVSGHAPAAYEQVLTTLAPQSATVVVLMGLASAGSIAATSDRARMEAGDAGRDHPWRIDGRLPSCGRERSPSLRARPNRARAIDRGTIVIGDVVRVGAMLAEFVGIGSGRRSGFAAGR